MHYSMLDVQCSMFDVHFYLTRHMKLAKGKVSFLIKLAAFQASGWADTWPPIPAYLMNKANSKSLQDAVPGFGGGVMK